MNRRLFLTQLRIQLRGIPSEEIDSILKDYEGYFDEAEANGISEEEASQNLGNPHELAKELKANHQGQPYQQVSGSPNSLHNVIVTIALVFFNLIIVLGPLIGIIGLFFGLAVMTAAFIISPLLTIVSMVAGNGYLFEFFLALILAGVGLFIFPSLLKLYKASYHYFSKYVQWNLRMMRGESS
ncbi:DUF1700 domain-containing protein [Lentibacillus sp. Marseille-P4043]|uniref:DUF1700 domain-containing protein n=1 Tax=Lentibacillus sp. Marseille-P4043 TaxID=2040293 RepID=UPI00131A5F7B|nr:DUF1700 domain-containing protein [Lentibacillus sp. Marseille-P4043]